MKQETANTAITILKFNAYLKISTVRCGNFFLETNTYIETLPNNNALTAVYVGPFRTKEDIDKNIDFIYEISETNSGEVVLWKP